MNKEEPYRDQAERLKKRIQKINEKVDGNSDKLPPREQVHRQKKKKTKWKVKYPIIRLLVLCFILLPIIIFSVISYRDEGVKVNGTQKTSGSSVGYETINLEKSIADNEGSKDESSLTKKETDKITAPEEKSVETFTQDESAESSAATPVLTTNQGTANQQVSDKNSQPIEAVKSRTTPTTPQKTSKTIYHTVKPKETLNKIAIRYYHSKNGVTIIKEANRLQTENIYVGQVLKIPLN
ncbi:LysM peptidoglycan-binding domain-containing protein [Neobacillus cucumis]|uniref:LysM peptidoglycan-binding domain-containing protein n=1 Tax=Neobacillus cucumis TaxID=1740721 RepID=UPI002040BB0E|nr:LysM peptidoglycan-binding domain-containing protein [Neobacillus cucumis]MCM3724436.1 LysM peptidoglycan-binding domain-containing protein [Neobacillus cucumis]